jgi:NAD(P)-dependent dehydrogenase (short-subunit alcohol dehydrogenase family)
MNMLQSAKVALVTGGSRGIGRGIAERLLADGHRVAITGRDEAKGKRALAELAAGERAVFLAADGGNQAEAERAVDDVLDRWGSIDILVNNVGGSRGVAEVASMPDADWQHTGDLILSSAMWSTRRALPGMVTAGWGRIINISSVESKRCRISGVSHYVTFKHAMNGFTRAVAAEYAKTGITCNALCPGGVETDLMMTAGRAAAQASGLTYEQFLQQYADETLTGRLVTVEEVAALAAFLVSDLARSITGNMINIDGGSLPY